MKLIHVSVRNFRSISEVDLPLRNLTTIIGRNNAGKSNLLRSIDVFATASDSALSERDICQIMGAGEETYVECTFGELSDVEKATFSKYLLHDNSVCIRRTLSHDGGKLKSKLHGWVEEPSNPYLKSDFADYSKKSTWEELGINFFDFVEGKDSGRITKADFEEFRAKYIHSNKAKLDFKKQLSSTELLGRQSSAVAALPTVTLIPAVGDVSSEIVGTAKSLLNIIVAEVLDASGECEEIHAATESLAEASNLINRGDSRIGLLTDIENQLSQQLNAWGNIDCRIGTEAPDLVKILLSNLTLSVNDGTLNSIDQKGHGIQRQILFQLFRLFVDLRRRRHIFSELPEPSAKKSESHIILFEEPELFLHPQAQEQFLDDLIAVSESDQILIATHSSHLIRFEYVDQLVILRRSSPVDPTRFFVAKQEWVASRSERSELKDIELLSAEISKMFFADKIVLVEGSADYVYIQGVARDLDCYSRKITIVSAGSKETLPRLQEILNGFQIPYVVTYDKDPGNAQSARTTARIVELVREARLQGVTCSVCEFDPTAASLCGNTNETNKDKPYQAHIWLRDNTPSIEFVDRVRQLFTISS